MSLDYNNWGEAYVFLLFVIGMLIGVSQENLFWVSIVLFFAGFLFGKTFYVKRTVRKIHLYMMAGSLLCGLLFGRVFSNAGVLILVYLTSMIIGYQVFKNKIL